MSEAAFMRRMEQMMAQVGGPGGPSSSPQGGPDMSQGPPMPMEAMQEVREDSDLLAGCEAADVVVQKHARRAHRTI